MPIIGSTLTFSAKLYDKDPIDGGVGVNAQSASLDILLPDMVTVLTPAVPAPSPVGSYRCVYTPTVQIGMHRGLWSFTMAGGQVAKYVQYYEVTSANPGYLVSLDRAKRHLNIDASDTTEDEEIEEWLAGITRVIEDKIGACIPRTVVEYQEPGRVIRLNERPVLAVQSMTPYLTAGVSYGPAQIRYTSDGALRTYDGRSFDGYGPFEITYTVGRNVVPANVTQAVKIILAHLWETQRGPAGNPLSGGDDVTLMPGLGYAVPNRAMELLEPDNEGPAVG